MDEQGEELKKEVTENERKTKCERCQKTKNDQEMKELSCCGHILCVDCLLEGFRSSGALNDPNLVMMNLKCPQCQKAVKPVEVMSALMMECYQKKMRQGWPPFHCPFGKESASSFSNLVSRRIQKTCDGCRRRFDDDRTLQLNCSHRICRRCLKAHIDNSLSNGWMPKCPAMDCTRLMNQRELEEVRKKWPQMSTFCDRILPFVIIEDKEECEIVGTQLKEESVTEEEDRTLTVRLKHLGNVTEQAQMLKCHGNWKIKKLVELVKKEGELAESGHLYVCQIHEGLETGTRSKDPMEVSGTFFKRRRSMHELMNQNPNESLDVVSDPLSAEYQYRRINTEVDLERTLDEMAIGDGDTILIDDSGALRKSTCEVDQSSICPSCKEFCPDAIRLGKCEHKLCAICLKAYMDIVRPSLEPSEPMLCPLPDCFDHIDSACNLMLKERNRKGATKSHNNGYSNSGSSGQLDSSKRQTDQNGALLGNSDTVLLNCQGAFCQGTKLRIEDTWKQFENRCPNHSVVCLECLKCELIKSVQQKVRPSCPACDHQLSRNVINELAECDDYQIRNACLEIEPWKEDDHVDNDPLQAIFNISIGLHGTAVCSDLRLNRATTVSKFVQTVISEFGLPDWTSSALGLYIHQPNGGKRMVERESRNRILSWMSCADTEAEHGQNEKSPGADEYSVIEVIGNEKKSIEEVGIRSGDTIVADLTGEIAKNAAGMPRIDDTQSLI